MKCPSSYEPPCSARHWQKCSGRYFRANDYFAESLPRIEAGTMIKFLAVFNQGYRYWEMPLFLSRRRRRNSNWARHFICPLIFFMPHFDAGELPWLNFMHYMSSTPASIKLAAYPIGMLSKQFAFVYSRAVLCSAAALILCTSLAETGGLCRWYVFVAFGGAAPCAQYFYMLSCCRLKWASPWWLFYLYHVFTFQRASTIRANLLYINFLSAFKLDVWQI